MRVEESRRKSGIRRTKRKSEKKKKSGELVVVGANAVVFGVDADGVSAGKRDGGSASGLLG